MRAYTLTHLSDTVLLHDLNALLAQERTTTAAVLAHIAEVDARRLYLPEGFPSMHAYCVGRLRFSEDAAYKRIQAARAARQFPAIFTALAAGRLHLTAVRLLAPHLRAANADELLAAATGKSRAEIEELLARRFPRTEMLALVQAVPPPAVGSERLAPAQVAAGAPEPIGASACQLAPAQVAAGAPEPIRASACQLAPGQVQGIVTPPQVKAWAAERYALQFTIGKATHEKLRYVQALMSHRLPSGDVAQVFDRALDALARQLEKRKFAATEKPRQGARRASANPRHIPAHVKRVVWERDGGRCSFVGAGGHRCEARESLELDHIEPVARGGRATVDNLRLRCRGHNQYEAERVFGDGFMHARREAARRARAETRDVMSCLIGLGFRAREARNAIECSGTHTDAGLEERVRAALGLLCPKARVVGRVETSLGAGT